MFRINGSVVKYGGAGVVLSDGDVIELGRELFTWQSNSNNLSQVSSQFPPEIYEPIQ